MLFTCTERSVMSLKRKTQQESTQRKKANFAIVQENVALIKEINDLRRDIKTLQTTQRSIDMKQGGRPAST